jgi:hypothetical protein
LATYFDIRGKAVINIKIDMDRFGMPELYGSYSLGRITIANDGTSDDPKRGHYNVTAYGQTGKQIRTGQVKNWPRQSRPVFKLVLAALKALRYA